MLMNNYYLSTNRGRSSDRLLIETIKLSIISLACHVNEQRQYIIGAHCHTLDNLQQNLPFSSFFCHKQFNYIDQDTTTLLSNLSLSIYNLDHNRVVLLISLLSLRHRLL